MTKIPLLTTGLNGLVGSKFRDLYSDSYSFDSLDISNLQSPVDITDFNQVRTAFTNSQAQSVLHLAAYTDVTGAWEQRDNKDGSAYKVNVTGTKNVVKAAEETKKHLILLSTSYVFDGEKKDSYLESDTPSPIEWYGQTKYLAEQAVQDSEASWTILRIDQPFRTDSFARLDTVHRVIQGLQKDTLHPQFTNHFFGPTYIDDLSRVIDWTIKNKSTGLYHASSGEKWSDYDFAQLVNQTMGLKRKIKKGDLDQYLKTSQRPYQRNTAMNCDKLKKAINFKMKSVKEAIHLVKI